MLEYEQGIIDEGVPIIILGPTAVGKTDVAIELAAHIGGEIVNADSVQVYIGMDIGTAKPGKQQRDETPFHLLDVVRPDEEFSVSEWKRRAETAITNIVTRNRRPIICGGTGLYIRAFAEDWSLAQTPADPEIRNSLKAEAEREGMQGLHAYLAKVDPVAANRLHPNDMVRIIRAIEVYTLTGKSITEHLLRDRQGRRPARRAIKIGLSMPREALYERINSRVDHMIGYGLEAEVRGLLENGYSPDLRPMRSLGYKEICDYLCGNIDRQTAIETIKLNTRRFSKRQMTWFRPDADIRWIDVSGFSSAKVATTALNLIQE